MSTINQPHLPIKRIAMLSVHTCPLAMMGGKKTGGMNVYVRDLARELGRQGIQVDVFTRSEDDCQPMIKHDLGYGGRVIHVQAGPEVPMHPTKLVPYLDDFAKGVIEFARLEAAEYDIIHSHYWLSGLVAGKLRAVWEQSQSRRPAVIQMFHTLGHMKNVINPNPDEKAPPVRIEGETEVIHEIADSIIAATPAEEEQLVRLYGADSAQIRVLPPGVDLSRFSPIERKAARDAIGVPCQGKNIMFVGRIEPLKGIDTLIEAAAILRDRHPELMQSTCFSIVGGDPWAVNPEKEMARLQALRSELQVEKLVGFLGAKNQNELPKYYASAEVVVMPSHYESFGLVALESMAMGTPVIASEVGGLAHLVKDGRTGFHIPPRDPEALADRIYDILCDDDLRHTLGDQAKAYAKEYDWSVVGCRMIEHYYRMRKRVNFPDLAIYS